MTTTEGTSAPVRQGLAGRVRRHAYNAMESPVTGRSGSPITPLLALGVAILLPVVLPGTFSISQLELVAIYAMVAIGLNLSFGYGGQLALAQPVIMGASAYTAALVNINLDWNAWMTLPCAIAAGVVLGIIASAPGYRLRGWYLAVTSIFLVVIFPDVILATQKWTGGDNGIGPIDGFPGLRSARMGEYLLILGVLAICFLLLRRVGSSHWGLALRTIRDAQTAAQASAIHTSKVKVQLAAVSALPVALAGWLWAHQAQFVGPSAFGSHLLLLIIAAVVLGGRGTLWGAIIGTIIFQTFSLWIGPFSPYNQIALGLGILVAALLFPEGIAPVVRKWAARRLAPPRTAALDHAARPVADGPSPDEPSPDEPVPDERRAASRGRAVVAATGLSKAFEGVKAVLDVSLELRGGDVLGLVGPNGSGKTTVLNMITGFVRPDSGVIAVGDVTPRAGSPIQMASRGVRRSFQVPQLVLEVSVRQNITVGLLEHVGPISSILGTPRYRRRARDYDKRVSEVCAELRFDEHVQDAAVEELSLGLRRIVEIGRAVVARPVAICLDEPAAGLGADGLVLVGRVLQDLSKYGYAVLLIEHNLSFVREVCDEILLLEEGVVRERADLSSIQRRGWGTVLAEVEETTPPALASADKAGEGS